MNSNRIASSNPWAASAIIARRFHIVSAPARRGWMLLAFATFVGLVVQAESAQDAKPASARSGHPGVFKPTKLGQTELFAALEGGLHGIAFDGRGSLFVAKEGREILRITPAGQVSSFAKVVEPRERTYIWSLAFRDDGDLFAAAQDCVLRVTTNGTVSTCLREDFTGEWGACDLRFDRQQRLWLVHGMTICRYDRDWSKTGLFAEKFGEMPPPVFVGLAFGPRERSVLVSYPFLKKVDRFTLDDGKLRRVASVPGFTHPQYLAVDRKGDAYVSQPDSNRIVQIGRDGQTATLDCENKLNGPSTLAFGRSGFDEKSLYVTAKGGVYRVCVGIRGLR